MASPYLWTPSLEPRTVINSSREVMINEAVALDKEEEDYEAQVLGELSNLERAKYQKFIPFFFFLLF